MKLYNNARIPLSSLYDPFPEYKIKKNIVIPTLFKYSDTYLLFPVQNRQRSVMLVRLLHSKMRYFSDELLFPMYIYNEFFCAYAEYRQKITMEELKMYCDMEDYDEYDDIEDRILADGPETLLNCMFNSDNVSPYLQIKDIMFATFFDKDKITNLLVKSLGICEVQDKEITHESKIKKTVYINSKYAKDLDETGILDINKISELEDEIPEFVETQIFEGILPVLEKDTVELETV